MRLGFFQVETDMVFGLGDQQINMELGLERSGMELGFEKLDILELSHEGRPWQIITELDLWRSVTELDFGELNILELIHGGRPWQINIELDLGRSAAELRFRELSIQHETQKVGHRGRKLGLATHWAPSFEVEPYYR